MNGFLKRYLYVLSLFSVLFFTTTLFHCGSGEPKKDGSSPTDSSVKPDTKVPKDTGRSEGSKKESVRVEGVKEQIQKDAGSIDGEPVSDEAVEKKVEAIAEKAKDEAPKGPPTLDLNLPKKKFRPNDNVIIVVKVKNFNLNSSEIGKKNQTGMGHYHVYLDQAKKPIFVSAANSAGFLLPTALTSGSHILRVSLRNNDHSELNPSVEKSVTIMYQRPQSRPSLMIRVSPLNVKSGAKMTLVVTVRNFKLDASKIGKANQKGVGHYHIYFDKIAKKFAANAKSRFIFTLPKTMTKGKHTIRVSLRRNDGKELKPKVEKSLSFTVGTSGSGKTSLDALLSRSFMSPGGRLSVYLLLKGFRLNAAGIGKTKKAGEGHYVVFLDKAIGSKYLLEGAKGTAVVTLPKTIKPGLHTLRIALRNNDRTELSPKIEKTLSFHVLASSAPSLGVYLSRSAVLQGGEIGLEVRAYRFKLDAAQMGKPNKKGFGHYRIYLDQASGKNFLAAGSKPLIKIKIPAKVSFGRHFLNIGLYQNDGSSLNPPIKLIFYLRVAQPTQPIVTVTLNKTRIKAGEKLELAIATQNFKLDAAQIGKPKKKGVGHYRIYLDNAKGSSFLVEGASAKQMVTIPKTTKARRHLLRTVLYNNDKTPVVPGVLYRSYFVVAATAPTFKCKKAFSGCKGFVNRTATTAKRIVRFGSSNTYSPKCIRIKVGQSITFQGSFSSHPLEAACEEKTSIPKTNSGAKKVIKFMKAGYYNYFCSFHGSKIGTGMSGNIWVTP